jgi:antitoxin StbD
MVMLYEILANVGVSISELKKNPSAVIRGAEGAAVAVLNRNRPIAYLIPASKWEDIIMRLKEHENS